MRITKHIYESCPLHGRMEVLGKLLPISKSRQLLFGKQFILLAESRLYERRGSAWIPLPTSISNHRRQSRDFAILSERCCLHVSNANCEASNQNFCNVDSDIQKCWSQQAPSLFQAWDDPDNSDDSDEDDKFWIIEGNKVFSQRSIEWCFEDGHAGIKKWGFPCNDPEEIHWLNQESESARHCRTATSQYGSDPEDDYHILLHSLYSATHQRRPAKTCWGYRRWRRAQQATEDLVLKIKLSKILYIDFTDTCVVKVSSSTDM